VLLTGTTDSEKKFHPFSINAFVEKWSKSNDSNIIVFLKHFKTEWIESTNSGWYEGAAIGIPSTDNGLESTNAQIKRHHTLGERMNVAEYLKNAKEMMFHWSQDRTLGTKRSTVAKTFAETPILDSELWKRAWHYLYKESPFIQQLGKTNTYVLTKTKHKSLIDENFIKKKYFQMRDSFDDFMKRDLKIKMVELDVANWEKSRCSCCTFLKNYACVHILSLTVTKKLVQIPMAYKAQPIGVKKKRGRPSKAKSCLVRQ
jgi:hypothetical protein